MHAEGLINFVKSKPRLTHMRACNCAIHAMRDWLFFKLKPSLTRKCAGNYAIQAVRDWLIF